MQRQLPQGRHEAERYHHFVFFAVYLSYIFITNSSCKPSDRFESCFYAEDLTKVQKCNVCQTLIAQGRLRQSPLWSLSIIILELDSAILAGILIFDSSASIGVVLWSCSLNDIPRAYVWAPFPRLYTSTCTLLSYSKAVYDVCRKPIDENIGYWSVIFHQDGVQRALGRQSALYMCHT